MNNEKPIIEVTKNGPYKVENLKIFKYKKDRLIETKQLMFLCRCGGSSNKPFCDGTHIKIGFTDEKDPDRVLDKMDNYEKSKLIIHDNRGVCSHRGYCTDNLPNVFRIGKEPWINPDGAEPDEVARVIRMCPSGALSYTKDGVLFKDFDRQPGVTVTKDGPYDVVGNPAFIDVEGNKPESMEHFTLCRCGQSKNKPFCNGQHWYVKFKD